MIERVRASIPIKIIDSGVENIVRPGRAYLVIGRKRTEKDSEQIRAVLDEYGRGGLYDNWDTTDSERSILENRENPSWNRSGMISMMEFHRSGSVVAR